MTSGPPTVFLIDDDASVRKALRRLLRAAGYEVEALDGADAYLDRLPPPPPACLLLDIRMPGKSGIDLQRAVQGTAHALPIIFITGHGDEDERVRRWPRARWTCSRSPSTSTSSSRRSSGD